MTANDKRAREATTTVACRIPLPVRRELELIQAEDGHDDLTPVLRKAFDDLIDKRRQERLRAA